MAYSPAVSLLRTGKSTIFDVLPVHRCCGPRAYPILIRALVWCLALKLNCFQPGGFTACPIFDLATTPGAKAPG